MQIVSSGDTLHEMSKPVFQEKNKKNISMSSAENFTQSATCYINVILSFSPAAV